MSEVTLYLTTRLQLDRAGAHPLARSDMQKCSVCVRREAESEWERKAERERKRAREKERDAVLGPAGRGGGAGVPSVADVTQIVQVPTQSHTNL